MKNLLSQELKLKVLRLKQLLDTLRASIHTHMPATATVDQVAKFFDMDWSVTRRFWQEGTAGGPSFIKAVKAKIGHDDLCDEILELLSNTTDNHKSLVAYPAGAIELAFDTKDAFAKARSQAGVVKRDQMNVEQFAAFFGDNREFVLAMTTASRKLLSSYSEPIGAEIRCVLAGTDWNSVSPGMDKSPGTRSTNKPTQLRRLLDQLRDGYPSRWAMLKDLGVHSDTLVNALTGKGRPELLSQLLRKAKQLVAIKSEPAELPKATPEPPLKEPHTVIGTYLSHLNSLVRMGEAMGISPESFTDGHRDNMIRSIGKLLALAKIDEAAVNRLLRREGLSASHPALQVIMGALSGAKS